MEWIQRNQKKAVALAALAVLCLVVLGWGLSGGSGTPSADPTLDGPSLATPTTSPTDRLTVLPTPSAVPTSVKGVLQGLSATGTGAFGTSFGSGSSKSLPRHHIVLAARSDGDMMAVGWWIPLADGQRQAGKTDPGREFEHADYTYGDADLGRILAYGGPTSRKTSCTVTVDGKVTEHQSARGPYAQVFCQG